MPDPASTPDRECLRFGVLGPLTVHRAGRHVPVAQAKHRIVLATLLLRPGQVVSTDVLIHRLWGDAPPPSARKTLQGYVARLRKVLGADTVHHEPGGYLLRVRPDQVDLGRLLDLLDRATGTDDLERRAALLDEALGLFRGTPLADVASDHLQRHDAAMLVDRWVAAVERWADTVQALGRGGDAVPTIRAALADHPFRESLWRRLMLALLASGRPADALAAYQEARRVLVDQLGVEPTARLREIHQHILAEAVEPPDDVLRGPRGRAERTAARDLATGGVVAVYGPAGSGRTTTATAIARAALSRTDGRLVLARLSDGGLRRDLDDVLADLLRGLDAPATGDTRDRLARYQREQARLSALVVLDDCVDGLVMRTLLPASGRGGAVVTSLRMLDALPTARHVRLAPFTPAEAMTALAEVIGAARVAAEPAAVADLVALCDGLPLPLRAAASRLAALPRLRVEQQVHWLSDPDRRLTRLTTDALDVRASLDAAYRHLERPARRALRLVSLLRADSFPLSAAAAALELPAADAEGLLGAAAAHHLLDVVPDERSGHRYRHIGLVRLRARELAADVDPVADRRGAVNRALSAWYRRGHVAAPMPVREPGRRLVVAGGPGWAPASRQEPLGLGALR
jgi:DNA-binding SARP family transcriptional activator